MTGYLENQRRRAMSKWYLRDWMAPQRIVVGTLTNVFIDDGWWDGDLDTNCVIMPTSDYSNLLINHEGAANDGDVLKGEVNIANIDLQGQHWMWRDPHLKW